MKNNRYPVKICPDVLYKSPHLDTFYNQITLSCNAAHNNK